MPEGITEATVRTLKADIGVFTSAVTLAPNLAEQSLKATVGMNRAIHSELFQLTKGALDWTESLVQLPFKIMREGVLYAEKMSAEMIGNLEGMGTAVVKAMRGSAQAANDVVSRIAESRVA